MARQSTSKRQYGAANSYCLRRCRAAPRLAQQYNTDMHPAWARKFEPPAVSSSETAGVIRALLTLHSNRRRTFFSARSQRHSSG